VSKIGPIKEINTLEQKLDMKILMCTSKLVQFKWLLKLLVGARDLRPLWSPPVSLNLVHVLETFNFLFFYFYVFFIFIIILYNKNKVFLFHFYILLFECKFEVWRKKTHLILFQVGFFFNIYKFYFFLFFTFYLVSSFLEFFFF
jgi:hypothetical protein